MATKLTLPYCLPRLIRLVALLEVRLGVRAGLEVAAVGVDLEAHRGLRDAEPLRRHIEENPGFIHPPSRANEILGFLREPLGDLCVSRPRARLAWGIPLPWDAEYVTYVWVDALINYLTASGAIHPWAPVGEQGFEDVSDSWWPADLHVIGKDITRFHCIYWPAMLLSAGIDPPTSVWAHGFAEFQGRKMSKSEGVTFELGPAIDRYGPDALRYYLLRDVPWNADGEVSWERFDERYTADLANDLGNLANRSLTMIERYRDGVLPTGERTELDARLADAIVAIESRGFIFGGALAERLNASFVPVRKPGKLPAETDSVSYSLEYGAATLQLHRDGLKEDARVIVVDDLLATGGTLAWNAREPFALPDGGSVEPVDPAR